MTRRLTTHQRVNFDGDELLILTCYEEGMKKEQIKKENPFSKKHEILINDGTSYEYVSK